MPAQILCHGVEKTYGDSEALRGVDLGAQGGLIGVLGPNGAGKTTLLRCLATVLRPTAGTVLIDGLDPRHESDRVEVRRRIGYLPQQHGFPPRAKVFDALDYIAVLKEINDDRIRRQWVFHVLELVGLRDVAARLIGDLSGGMRQRLGMAQALIGNPTLLLLDEPAAGVDPAERLRFRDIIAQRRDGATVVLSTHLTEEVAACDRVVILHHGTTIFVGPPSAVAERARDRVWIQSERPRVGAIASWQQADGTHRCLGSPPPAARLAPPSIEEGYLLVLEES